MTKWIKKWDKCSNDTGTTEDDDVKSMKTEMKNALKYRSENPKKIDEFEDIYMRPQPSNIVEGLENQEDDDDDDDELGEPDNPFNLITNTKKGLSNISDDLKKPVANPINSLENDLSNTFDGLSKLGDFDMDFGDLFSTDNTISGVSGTEFLQNFKDGTKNIEEVATEVSSSMLTISQVISNVFLKIGGYLNAIKLSIMLFMLRVNRYVKTLITNISNALTQNTATEAEIDTFQDQVQKFISILLTWFFVYNWYYIVFFLEDVDNIRYTFEVDEIKKTSKVLYGLIGPACHVLERFDFVIMGIGKKIKKWKTPNALIMVGMFLLFYSLVQMNFQTSLLFTFFNAMRGKYGISLISLSTFGIVGYYALQFMFGQEVDGYMEIQKAVVESNGFFMMCFFIVIMILYFAAYMMWIVAVNVPLGVLLISTYLVVYSFIGVFVHEGFNCFNIISNISDSIDTITPDIGEEACKPEFEISQIPKYIWDWCVRMVNYASINMFEILILLTLLGGIGVYGKDWSTASAGKVGISSSPTTNVQQAFKYLFTWLILINILLIVILCIYLYRKMKVIWDLQTGTSGVTDKFQTGQTMRSRMAGLNNPDFDGQVMRDVKVDERRNDNVVSRRNYGSTSAGSSAAGSTTTATAAGSGSGSAGAGAVAGSGSTTAATPAANTASENAIAFQIRRGTEGQAERMGKATAAAYGSGSDSDSGSLNQGSYQKSTRTRMERRQGLSDSAGGW